jgi:hypothetical protein
MVEEYISVAEFAKRAGISKQEAYSIARSPQNEAYTKRINGKIQIAVELLKPLEAPASPQKPKEEKPVENAEAPVNSPENRETAVIDFLMKQIEELREEVRSKDKQIAEHNARIALLLEKQQELTEKALITTGQAQYLQANNSQPVVEDKPARSIWKRLFSKNT